MFDELIHFTINTFQSLICSNKLRLTAESESKSDVAVSLRVKEDMRTEPLDWISFKSSHRTPGKWKAEMIGH